MTDNASMRRRGVGFFPEHGKGNMAQVVHTICMQTEDAISRKEGEFTMPLGGDNPRLQAVKLSLGSLEFPMVQYTIEEDWARLYVSESLRLDPDNTSLLIEEITSEEGTVSTHLKIPSTLNEVVEYRVLNDFVVVKCRYPHNLWIGPRRVCAISSVDWGDVEVICAPMGRLSLTFLHKKNRVQYLSETEFMVPSDLFSDTESGVDGAGGFLYVPPYPSPTHLCAMLSKYLSYISTVGRLTVDYDESTNKVRLKAQRPPTTAYTLRLNKTKLGQLLGYTSSLHERRHKSSLAASSLMDAATDRDDVDLLRGDNYTATTGCFLESEQYNGWDYCEIPPGWYTPTHRAMALGQTLRFQQEIELALNRLYMPLVQKMPKGAASGHFFVFSDPCGHTHNVQIFCGQHNPTSMASHLESAMTALSASTCEGVSYSVIFEDDRYTLSCDVRTEQGDVVPACFAVLFHHPMSIDPKRLGFDELPLCGSDSYTSIRPVHFPTILGRPLHNIYRVSDIGHLKTFRFQSTCLPPLTCLVLGYDPENSELHLRTYVGETPFAHGLSPNTLVQLAPSPTLNILSPNDVGVWSEVEVAGANVAPRFKRYGVVLALGASDMVIDLRLRVRSAPRLVECVNNLLQVQTDLEPFNMCFSTLPKSLKARSVGFPPGAVLWGKHGSICRSNDCRVPPFDAPYVHSLDHPDYILVYLSEGNTQRTMHHTYNNRASAPFAKLVLFPMVREERMLPRDTSLMGGTLYTQFTIRFTNPDGTPYHFHGAHFSFSLNFVRYKEMEK